MLRFLHFCFQQVPNFYEFRFWTETRPVSSMHRSHQVQVAHREFLELRCLPAASLQALFHGAESPPTALKQMSVRLLFVEDPMILMQRT